MAGALVISVDVMGGDHGPAVILPGLARLLPDPAGEIGFLLHGDRDALAPLLAGLPKLGAASEVRHTRVEIPMDAKPAHAMRRGRGSSMWNAVEAVRERQAHAAVSAGNTGALMAVSRLLLRQVARTGRPAPPVREAMTRLLEEKG